MWLLRLAALAAAFVLLRRLLGWCWRQLAGAPAKSGPTALPPRQGTLARDPVCGMHLDTALAVREAAGGETLYFCSERCRDAYRARGAAATANEVRKTG